MAEKDCREVRLTEKSKPAKGAKIRKHKIEVEVKIKMVELHGKAPYKAVLIHGGPGAIGSLKNCAEELSILTERGIVEALQSQYSIAGLVEELYLQIMKYCQEKPTLIGHSWGAWLAVLFAGKYPKICKNIILVGCPPLADKYVKEISLRRLRNLSDEESKIFQRMIDNVATDEDIKKIPSILEKSDNYYLESSGKLIVDKADNEMYNRIWNEATKLRTNGELLTAFKNIQSKLFLIQGVCDPHPIEGVMKPLEENGIPCKTYILEKCGHNPFMEKYAKEKFYDILQAII